MIVGNLVISAEMVPMPTTGAPEMKLGKKKKKEEESSSGTVGYIILIM